MPHVVAIRSEPLCPNGYFTRAHSLIGPDTPVLWPDVATPRVRSNTERIQRVILLFCARFPDDEQWHRSVWLRPVSESSATVAPRLSARAGLLPDSPGRVRSKHPQRPVHHSEHHLLLFFSKLISFDSNFFSFTNVPTPPNVQHHVLAVAKLE
jgi:hypothetical protein